MDKETKFKIFNNSAYLEKYPDVAKAVYAGRFKSGHHHYLSTKNKENRIPFYIEDIDLPLLTCDILLVEELQDISKLYKSLKGQFGLNIQYTIIGTTDNKEIIEDKNVRILSRSTEPIHKQIQSIIPVLKTKYFIPAIPYHIDDPGFIRKMLCRLEVNGNEAACREGDGCQLMVFRKDSILDIGGLSDQEYYFWEDLLKRIKLEKRPIDYGGELRHRDDQKITSTHHGMGWTCDIPGKCDVILSFHDQIESTEAVIESLINQTEVEPIIHLIDDASSEDTTYLFKKYEQLKIYQNKQKLGPYVSANSVYDNLETNYFAIANSNYLNDNNRLREQLNLITLTNADAVSSEIEGIEFGGVYPYDGCGKYCAHESIMFNKFSFRKMNGYSNFKLHSDVDLSLRLYYGGFKVIPSTSTLVRMARPNKVQYDDNIITMIEKRARTIYKKRWCDMYAFGDLSITEQLNTEYNHQSSSIQ